MVTYNCGHVLSEVGKSMKSEKPSTNVTVPFQTTWKACLQAVSSELGADDGSVSIFPPVSAKRRQDLREEALRNVKNNAMTSTPQSLTKPIRLHYVRGRVAPPGPLSKEARERVKENAQPFLPFQDPYPVAIRAAIEADTLPIITARLRLESIDDEAKCEIISDAKLLFDTGAQQTIITDDILSHTFHRYLDEPINDPYRFDEGCRVQISANISFSNALVTLSTIALVVRRNVVPNMRSGVIFGQKGGIDSICYRSVPYKVLQAMGEDVDENTWGDLIVDQYVDQDGFIVKV